MSDEDVLDDMVEIGECGNCHEMKEITATMSVGVKVRGESLGEPGSDVDLCEECIPKVMAEFAALASGKVTVTMGEDAGG